MQPRMENKSKLPAGDQPPWNSPHEVLQFWLINAAYYLLVNDDDDDDDEEEEEEEEEEEDSNNNNTLLNSSQIEN